VLQNKILIGPSAFSISVRALRSLTRNLGQLSPCVPPWRLNYCTHGTSLNGKRLFFKFSKKRAFGRNLWRAFFFRAVKQTTKIVFQNCVFARRSCPTLLSSGPIFKPLTPWKEFARHSRAGSACGESYYQLRLLSWWSVLSFLLIRLWHESIMPCFRDVAQKVGKSKGSLPVRWHWKDHRIPPWPN